MGAVLETGNADINRLGLGGYLLVVLNMDRGIVLG